MSVCLYVRWHISKPSSPNFTKVSLCVKYGRGSVSVWRQYNVLGYVLPVLRTTSCLYHNGTTIVNAVRTILNSFVACKAELNYIFPHSFGYYFSKVTHRHRFLRSRFQSADVGHAISTVCLVLTFSNDCCCV